MGTIKNIFRNNMRQYGMLIALVVIMGFFQIATKGILLVPMNVTNLILQNSYVLILAIGMTLCIVAGGHIDLSVGSMCAFIGALVGTMIITFKVNVWIAIGVALLIGVVVGIWQGFWIAYVRIPSFIVTLAGQLIFRGLTITILDGQTLSPFPESFQKISGGFIPDLFGKTGINLNILTLIVGLILSFVYIMMEIRKRNEKMKYAFEITPVPMFITQVIVIVGAINLLSYWLASYKGIPVTFVIIGALIVIYTIFTTNTAPGRYIYAMGGNEKAAKLSGVKVNKMLFLVYVNMAVMTAIAGISFASRLNAASPQSGLNFELDAIAACFIGGASAYGGIGTVIGAIIGAMVMGVLNNGMSIMGLGSDWQQTVKGMVLLAAVAFDVYSKKKARG
jgi:putative multiple sugar transport system permease protein